MLTALLSGHHHMEQQGGGGHGSRWGQGGSGRQEAVPPAGGDGTDSSAQSGSESLWDMLLMTGMVSPSAGGGLGSNHSQGVGVPSEAPFPSVHPNSTSPHHGYQPIPGPHPVLSSPGPNPSASQTTTAALLSALRGNSNALTPAQALTLNSRLGVGMNPGVPTASPFPLASPLAQILHQKAATYSHGVPSVNHGAGASRGAPAANPLAGVNTGAALASLLNAGAGANAFTPEPWQGAGTQGSSRLTQSAQAQLLLKALNSSLPPFQAPLQGHSATVGQWAEGAVSSAPVGLWRSSEEEARKTSPDGSRRFVLKGVRQRRWGKWVAEIKHPEQSKRIWLGTYDSADEAVRAYNKAAVSYYGEAAKLNPLPSEIRERVGRAGAPQPGPKEKAASLSKATSLQGPFLSPPRPSGDGVPSVALAYQNEHRASSMGHKGGTGQSQDPGINDFGLIPRASSVTHIVPHSQSHFALNQNVASSSILQSYHGLPPMNPSSHRLSLTEAEAFLLSLDQGNEPAGTGLSHSNNGTPTAAPGLPVVPASLDPVPPIQGSFLQEHSALNEGPLLPTLLHSRDARHTDRPSVSEGSLTTTSLDALPAERCTFSADALLRQHAVGAPLVRAFPEDQGPSLTVTEDRELERVLQQATVGQGAQPPARSRGHGTP